MAHFGDFLLQNAEISQFATKVLASLAFFVAFSDFIRKMQQKTPFSDEFSGDGLPEQADFVANLMVFEKKRKIATNVPPPLFIFRCLRGVRRRAAQRDTIKNQPPCESWFL